MTRGLFRRLASLYLFITVCCSSFGTASQNQSPGYSPIHNDVELFERLLTCPIIRDTRIQPTVKWHLWSHKPYCVYPEREPKLGIQYCVFTYSSPEGGRAISLFISPEIAPVVMGKLKASGIYSTSFSEFESDEQTYRIVDLPERGKGMIASRKIPQWEAVMSDFGSIIVDPTFTRALSHDQIREVLPRMTAQLPKHQEGEVLALAQSAGLEPIMLDILKTNVFGININDVPHAGIFTKSSRINHNCRPNIYWIFDEVTMTQRIIALRSIEVGEEIGYSYLPIGYTHARRQEILLRDWNFNCTCEMCTSSSQEIASSDKRRERLWDIEFELTEGVRLDEVQIGVLLGEIHSLAGKEGLQPLLSQYYQNVSRAYMRLYLFAQARKYLTMAEALWILYGGAQHPNVKGVNALWSELRESECRSMGPHRY